MAKIKPFRTSIEAVVFDLDGVLIDSELIWDRVRRKLAADCGLAWPAAATLAMQGMSTPEWGRYLTATVGIPGTDADASNLVIEAMAARYRQQLPLLPGAVEVVRALAGRWPLGLASSSPRLLIDTVLAASGMSEFFTLSVSTEEVEAGKPSPAVYLLATELLGVNPAHTVAIEDSSNGIRSAASAGLIVLAVPHPAFPPATEALALATAQVDRLADITPELVGGLPSVD